MKKLCFALALALAFVFSVGVSAREIDAATENSVFPEYSYDTETSLLEVSLHYGGEGISAIGISLTYDTDIMEYTSYVRGDGFCGFTLRATLENSGAVNVLSYSPTEYGEGEIIRLCFKIKDISRADGFVISPKPLTDIPCAKIENGAVREIDLKFLSVRFSALGELPSLEFSGISRSGELLFMTDSYIDDCIVDVTVVELSGGVHRSESYEKCKKIKFEGREASYFSIWAESVDAPYAAVIIDVYAEYNGVICYSRNIYLFREGKFLG